METNKILPIKSDIIFRIFFADERNEEFLLSFLKSVLQLPKDEYEEITILDPHLLREFDGDKLGIIDIKLKTKSKKVIHVEIQVSVNQDLINRIIFYDSKLIVEQIGSGDNYDVIKKVISIVITDEELIKNSTPYHHRFTFYDRNAGVELTDLIEVNLLELPKLPKNTDGTVLYDWAAFIAAESEEELKMVAERNPEVKKAVVKLQELSADERTRHLYESREMLRRDIASQNKWAREEGKQEGISDVARKLLKRGRPINEIVEDTGLTIEEIEQIKDIG